MNTTAIQKATPQAQQKPSAMAVMASRLSVDPVKLHETLKATVFAKASNDEMLALVVVANEYGLNPLLKELYAFPAKGGGIVPIVSVDGWNKMLIRQESFDGIEFEMVDGEDGKPHSCTATIHVKGRSKPVKITEYFEECYRNTEPWNNMPRRMLRNRTLCQAARVAFGFAGVYERDEAEPIIDVSEAPPKMVRVVSTEAEAPKALPAASSENVLMTPNAELETLVLEAGHTFDHFQKWAVETENIREAASLSGFGDIKAADAKRVLRNKAGLLAELENVKGAQ